MTILLLDTSSSICRLTIIIDGALKEYEWQSDRSLAKGLLGFINSSLNDSNKKLTDISAIGVFSGPGSFTGLRIGLTVANTIADSQDIPIVSGLGESWKAEVVDKIKLGKNEKIVLPFYNAEANITLSKK